MRSFLQSDPLLMHLDVASRMYEHEHAGAASLLYVMAMASLHGQRLPAERAQLALL
jgi:hypothetical protein